MCKVRLDAFLTFYGLWLCYGRRRSLAVQRGIAETEEVPWWSRPEVLQDGEQLNSDELHLRTFWRRWNGFDWRHVVGGGVEFMIMQNGMTNVRRSKISSRSG